MAGNDRRYDVRGGIANLIAFKVRELLETPLNEYQDPAWVQAAELFVEIVIPCEAYSSEALYDLGVDIAKEAEKRSNRAMYQAIPGMYNRRTVPGSISAGSDTEEVDYSSCGDDKPESPFDRHVKIALNSSVGRIWVWLGFVYNSAYRIILRDRVSYVYHVYLATDFNLNRVNPANRGPEIKVQNLSNVFHGLVYIYRKFDTIRVGKVVIRSDFSTNAKKNSKNLFYIV